MLSLLGGTSETTTLKFALDYLNTASAKWLFIILRDLLANGNNIRVDWYYERGDEDMLDLGLIYRSLLNCQFETIEVDEIPLPGQSGI
jgi:hypothetical protein